jgi:DNA-binding response OmpR family regulator
MKKILIIEDDPVILKGLQASLEEDSYNIHTVSDGEKGYFLALKNRFDLIILDIMLPNKNGFDICRDLRSNGIVTLILMLTSKTEEIDKVLGLEVGADDYMTKPFSLNELKARIRALLRRAEIFSKKTKEFEEKHKPKEEVRIFMFLDMKSSTTIAEKLGHVKYYNLLNDFFYDVSEPILQSKGEIYQYVGDEIVVSWLLGDGLQNMNCIECFFKIVEAIKNFAEKYENHYGLVPEFKAGLHYGNVTTGEIGVEKRETVYTGDVLNTTSRIQELCNSYNEKLLISKTLLDHLSIHDKYKINKLGEITLRGRKNTEILFSINKS